jgi:hypothetical protein
MIENASGARIAYLVWRQVIGSVVQETNPGMGKTFSLVQNVHTIFGDPTASYSIGTGVVSQRCSGLVYEVDHSPPSSAEVENEWSCTSAPLIYHHGVHRDRFTFSIFQFTSALCHDSKVSCRFDAADD